MDSEHITGVFGQLCSLSTPVSAHVSEEQLPEDRVFKVTVGNMTAAF